jgi:hypothetical protein
MIDSKNVFINCPFDNTYFPLLKSLLFTLVYLDLNPQICETRDSTDIRISEILKLMSISKYSIHDLSRIELLPGEKYPRFNMPFEYGMDYSLKKSANLYDEKIIIVIEKERHRYKEVLSDISGGDITPHNNDQETMVKAIRKWFSTISNTAIPGPKEIWLAYSDFQFYYATILENYGLDPNDIDSIPFSETIKHMNNWIITYKT